MTIFWTWSPFVDTFLDPLTPAPGPVSKIRPSFFGREVKTYFNGDPPRNQRRQLDTVALSPSLRRRFGEAGSIEGGDGWGCRTHPTSSTICAT
jgi:hypothetical protein